MSANIKLKKIYKIIRDTGKKEKEDVIRCLEMVAWEVDELCATWEKIIKLSNKKSKITKNEMDNVHKTILFGNTTPLYGRIINFYRNISAQLENKFDINWIVEIYNQVAQVILYKKDIKETLKKFDRIKWSQTPMYISSDNNDKMIKDLYSSLQILQNEVNILKTLPKMMKTISTEELARL